MPPAARIIRLMGAVSTAAGNIGLLEQGGGLGVPIVFLHGVGSDKTVWVPQLDHFGRERRAIAFDYPGYGESDFVAGATRDDFARSILAALDALGIERAHICGLSLGGVIAIALHHLAPERCVLLILADSFAVHPDGQGIHDRSVEASRTLGMRGLAEARAATLLGSKASPDIAAAVIETMSLIDPRAYRLGAAAVWLASQEERARAIGVPTLVLVGSEDVITPPALSRRLAELIDGASLEVIEGAGHLANIEKPAQFNRAVSGFIAKSD